MSLAEHLRELRTRLVISAVAVLLCAVGGWFLYEPFIKYLNDPLVAYAEAHDTVANLNFGALAAPFDLKIKVSIYIGIVLSSPIIIWQIWRFITPGLKSNERKYTLGFVAAAVPLFLSGCYVAWLVLPKASEIMLSFQPEGSAANIDASNLITFSLRLILIFGIIFLFPVVLVALNFVGILSAKNMLRAWRWAVFVMFLFSAIVTPVPDATVMIAVAMPLVVLFFAAVGVAALNDRRRRRKLAAEGLLFDEDEKSVTTT